MSGECEKLNKKWSIIKEQLIALCALNKLPKGNETFTNLLCEDIQIQTLNSQNLTLICYFILGIINFKERDKLIRWPLINIATHTKFRKGMSAMIKGFQDKYPWAHIRKLPESYFMSPHGYESRVLDFLSRLTNLAIHVALNDLGLLLMHSGDGLNSNEIAIMTEIVSRAREAEEEILKSNVLPLEEIEIAKNEICDKCIALKQENDDLQQQLDSLKKEVLNEQLITDVKIIDIKVLKEIKDKKFTELDTLIKELSKYHELSQELLSKVKALKNPINLTSKDFGGESSFLDLKKATSTVCNDLYQFFQYISSSNSFKAQNDNFHTQLKLVKESMKKENKALCSVLGNISVTPRS